MCSSVGHGEKTGTNLFAALQNVKNMIAFVKQNSKNNHFDETQNVIIIATDGKERGQSIVSPPDYI